MNQLFTFNSQQFSSHLKHHLPKKIKALEETHIQIKPTINNGTLRSKKRIKRYQQIMEIATRNVFKPSNKCLNTPLIPTLQSEVNKSINSNLQTATLRIVQKRQQKNNKQRIKRCNSEMNTGKHEQNLLFTFYPKESVKQPENKESEINTSNTHTKKIELRSYSLKNSPIVDYPNCNKVLPKAFRMKYNTDQQPFHFKKIRHLSELSTQEKKSQCQSDTSLPLKQNNRLQRLRNFSIKSHHHNNLSSICKNKGDICLNLLKLQKKHSNKE